MPVDTPALAAPDVRSSQGGASSRRLSSRLLPLVGVIPFALLVFYFLLLPTLVVAVGSFLDEDNRFTLANLTALTEPIVRDAYARSIVISGITAVLGAVLGALLAYAVATATPDGALRRVVTAACGVLAQFGGVMLAFAFIATVGFQGLVTVVFRDQLGLDIYGGGWLFATPGLILVYTYFQIPLMVIVFLPALDGLRPQWREAAETLGGSTWDYWWRVGGPILWPSFLGGTLLLFANAFSAYATAKALISQASPIVPLKIDAAISGEVVQGAQNLGKSMALGMVVVVAVVMWLYARLQKRTARWLR
jgi:putative spermidine/putrescine transport system permease protein